jgi:hypothetical protein
MTLLNTTGEHRCFIERVVRIVVIANIVDHNYFQKRITDCASLHTESNAEHFQHLSIIR